MYFILKEEWNMLQRMKLLLYKMSSKTVFLTIQYFW